MIKFKTRATLYGGSIRFTTPMLYAIAFLFIFTIGGCSGVLLSNANLDVAFHDTYFVVGQEMARFISNNKYEIDYMQGTIFLSFYLLYLIYKYLIKIDELKLISNIINSKYSKNDKNLAVFINKYSNIQSAENFKGFSETIRQSSYLNTKGRKDINKNNKIISNKFWNWLAGILDGNGYFQVKIINKKIKFKSIEIKLHNRDIRILIRILDKLHIGKIYRYKNNSKWIISNRKDIIYVIKNLNGLIRLKVKKYKRACEVLNIKFIEANYNIEPNDPYLAGLIDTDGSIIFNFSSNRIECNLELKLNDYSKKLCLNNVIPNYKPSVYLRKHNNSIIFKYQTVNGMIYLYKYFMLNRLYSDMKFYRIAQILKFMKIRKYKNYNFESKEYLIYSKWLLNWIKYQNPKWYKVPFVSKLRMKK